MHENAELAIGLMSGTSVDGIDAGLVEISATNDSVEAELKAFLVHPYPPALRQRIFKLFEDQAGALCLACELNFEIGREFAHATLALLKQAGISPGDISLIGSHGQTVYHIPPLMAASEEHIASTLQIGEASIIAQMTGIPTVSDFRTADMAAGGNGAPLITFADYHLLRDKTKGRVVQNIGGIANCTLLPANCALADVLAFDTGPGNMIIDGLVARMTDGREACDRDARLAASGVIDQRLLKDLLAHPYFSAPPPKTTGRELFGLTYVDQLRAQAKERRISDADLVATATALTAESILHAYRDFVFPRMRVDEVILGGGGAQNPFLVRLLRLGLPDKIQLLTHEDVGIDSKAKEAIGFALLGWARIHNIPGNVPSATGASHQVLLGKIYQAE